MGMDRGGPLTCRLQTHVCRKPTVRGERAPAGSVAVVKCLVGT